MPPKSRRPYGYYRGAGTTTTPTPPTPQATPQPPRYYAPAPVPTPQATPQPPSAAGTFMSRLASSFRTLYYGLGNPAMRALPPREPNLGRRPFYAGPYYYSGLQYGGDEDFPTQRGLKRSVSGPREIETRTWGHLKSRPGPGQPSYVERFFMNLPFTVEAPTEPMGGYSQIPPPQPPEMAGGGGGGGYYYPGYGGGGGGGGYSYPEYTPTPQYFTEYRGGSRAARGGVAPRTPTMRTAAPPRAGPAYAPRLAQPPRYFQLLTSWRI